MENRIQSDGVFSLGIKRFRKLKCIKKREKGIHFAEIHVRFFQIGEAKKE